MVAINNLYMAKMPNSCKECPLTYLDTGDDAYFGANERRCVIDDSCIDGMTSERAYDCPLVEAIPKDQYKADMIAVLEDIKEQLREMHEDFFETEHFDESYGVSASMDLIEQEIDKLKGGEAGNDK